MAVINTLETNPMPIQVCAELIGIMETEVDITVDFQPQNGLAGKT